MKTRNRWLILGVTAAIIIVSGIWLYNWVLGDTLEASAPISALPVETEAVVVPAPVETEAAAAPEAAATSAPVETQAVEAAANQGGTVTLQIQSAESEVRFNIYEELAGSPKDVIGVSDQVAGQVVYDPADLSQVQFGVIQVNARTLSTDSERRNSAIRNRILNTDQYEFIRFKPLAVEGLSGALEVGKSYTFTISGELTIRDITQTVVFEVTALAEAAERLSGSARTVINRADYQLTIPSVPSVANVGEQVTLEIDFVMAP